MRFWDSSAILPLLVTEATTPVLTEAFREDPVMLVWWGTEVECASALARVERDADANLSAITASFARLDALRSAWHEVDAVEVVRITARRLLRTHVLRAADALQLAAAFAASEGQPSSQTFVSLDGELVRAARREGFDILEIAT